MSDAAVVSIVTGFVTIATLWLKLKYESKKTGDKIDANTALTEAGTAIAAVNAKVAATAASDAKTAVQSIDKKLNGGIDSAINQAVEPIRIAFEEHTKKDVEAMAEVKSRFDALTEYVHQRNHDILNAINAQSLKLDAALVEIKSNSRTK